MALISQFQKAVADLTKSTKAKAQSLNVYHFYSKTFCAMAYPALSGGDRTLDSL
ncbi:MAG: hypothetical protein ICV54_18135 [Nostoc sp. C3-bin3]|nr:hypothetical protein [Nostoc sp. C3-bin3]